MKRLESMDMIKQAFYEHRWLFLVVFVYIGCVVGTALALGAPFRELSTVIWRFSELGPMLIFYIAAIIPVWFVRAVIDVRAEKKEPWGKAVVANMTAQTDRFFSKGYVWRGAVAMLVLVLAQLFFCIGKSLIPRIVYYTWDPALSAFDKWLHFGYYPHEFVTPFIKALGLQEVVYYAYQYGWAYVCFVVQGYCIFLDTDPVRRMRLLWTMVLSWIVIGLFMAGAFASVGPVFYGVFHGSYIYNDVFKNLFAIEKDAKVSFYHYLIRRATEPRILGTNAISAMPSMHVAVAFLNCLYFYSINKTASAVFAAYSMIILMGSVYLGWHYAIDGYVAIAAISLLWWLCGKVIRRHKQHQQAPTP